MHVSGKRRVAAASGGIVLLVCSLLSFAPLASSQEAGDPIELRGFATGQPVHISALESGGTRVLNTDVSWSGAAVDADANGLAGTHVNEFDRIFQPDKANKLSYARASGLEVGAGTTNADPNQIQLTALAEADAAPSSSDTQETAVEGGDPAFYASQLSGTAVANANESGLVPDVCVLGDDLARGVGFVEDAEFVDAGGDTESPNLDSPLLSSTATDPNGGDRRAANQSTSRLRLIPTGRQNYYGLMAEVRQTISPMTVAQDVDGDPNTPDTSLFTVEFLGEWVLRVVATGSPGGASVHLGPGEASPETPILNVLQDGVPVQDPVLFQDLFGEEGLDLELIPGVLEMTVGEDPRAIAAPGEEPDAASQPELAANGRKASAAVDVLRLRILDGQVADIRSGHMEVGVEVPEGGVFCPIPVDKSADPDNIKIAEEPDTTTVEITVHNPYDCDLTETVLVDRIRQQAGSPDFKLLSAEPSAESPSMPTGALTTADVTWKLGTIEAGGEKSVSLELQSASHGGILRDIATATGKFANCAGSDTEGLAIAGLVVNGLSVPVDIAIETPVTGAQAAQTAATGGGLAVAAGGLGLLLRRRKT